MSDPIAQLLDYIDRSPTPYHAVATTTAMLEAQGYSAIDEAEEWRLARGDRRYVVDGGTVAAFEIGSSPAAECGFRIIGAHTDSPNLRVKPKPELSAHGYRQLAVEPYGGALLHTWIDRDLSLAGRVVIRRENNLESVLVDFERPFLRVPSLAIHLHRELRDKGLKLNPQTHLASLFGLSSNQTFEDALASEVSRRLDAPVSPSEITAFELMTYDVQPAARGGIEGEFILAARLDNLASCHAATAALTAASAASASSVTRVIILYDHEEVGSRSAHGADGPFLSNTLERIAEATGGGSQSFQRALTRSRLVSLDMAHAVHPNYADRHEPEHRPVVGSGPVIKSNVNLAYATDACTAGMFADLCRCMELQPQYFVSRSDLPCGSTIGPLTAARIGIATVDVGNPMLSMHSCREMAGSADVAPMIAVLTSFLQSA